MTFSPTFEFAADDEALGAVSPNQESYRRRLVILMIDLSGSMGAVHADVGRPIDALNERLTTWVPTVRDQGSGPLRDVEFAIVTYSGAGVGLLTPTGIQIVPHQRRHDSEWPELDVDAFVPAARLVIPELEATGTTPLVRALTVAIELGDRRVAQLALEGVETGQVRVLLFSDGGPNEVGMPDGLWESIVDRVHTRREELRMQLFAFGVPGADDGPLSELAGPDGYKQLNEFDFALLLDLILIATSADDPYEALRDINSPGQSA